MIYGMGLCAGAGGLELGLRIALGDDYRCVVYVEREAYAAATLVARMADEALDQAPVWDDLSDFDGSGWRGVVDLVSAGFSCQPWSAAGKRLGIADERWLWPDLHRVICEARPEWVFLENVPGLVHGGIEHVLRDLAASGFAAEWDCVSAAEVGASQLRQRLYILARATRGGRRVGGQSSGSGGQFDRDGQTVADGDREGCTGQRSGRLSINGHAAHRDNADGRERPSALLGDANDRRRGGWSSDPQRRPFGGTAAQGTGSAVGDTDSARLEGRRCDIRCPDQRPARTTGPETYWPPDRRYRGEWPHEFEPAVRRVVDGMAPWVDRLRLTGNGVVPLAAAVAFLRLRARLLSASSTISTTA